MHTKKLNTKEKLLITTYNEVYKNGYHATGLTHILQKANINKGSMYHIYKSKKEMMLDVINTIMKDNLEQRYQSLYMAKNNIIKELITIIKDKNNINFKYGCSLNNLIQELSSCDEDFKLALEQLYLNLENIIQDALNKAIILKEIKPCHSKNKSMYIVALIEGALITAKKSQDINHYYIVINQLEKELLNL